MIESLSKQETLETQQTQGQNLVDRIAKETADILSQQTELHQETESSSPSVWDKLHKFVDNLQGVGKKVSQTVEKAKEIGPDLLEQGKTMIEDKVEKAKEIGSDLLEHGKTLIEDKVEKAKEIGSDLLEHGKEIVTEVARDTVDIAKDAGYEIIKGAVEGVEGTVDVGLTIVADVAGILGQEQAREKVIDIITNDYSAEVVKYVEPLKTDKLETMGEVGVLIQDISRAAGLVAGTSLFPGGSLISAVVGEIGNDIEKYYQENDTQGGATQEVTLQTENGAQTFLTETVSTVKDIVRRTDFLLEKGIEKGVEAASAAGRFAERVAETAADCVGNVVVGTTGWAEGIADDILLLGGLAVPQWREDAQRLAQFDVAGKVQNFVDSITPNSYLNESKIETLVDGTMQVLGKIAPAIAITAVSQGNVIGTIANRVLLETSFAGSATVEALSNPETISYEHACAYGAAVGLAEMGIEALTGGIAAYGPGIIKHFNKNILTKSLGEGFEGVLSGTIQPLLKGIATGEIDTSIYETKEFWEKAIQNFAIGATTSLIINGIASKVTAIQEDQESSAKKHAEEGVTEVEKKQSGSFLVKKQIVEDVDSGKIQLGENGAFLTTETGNYGEMRTSVEFLEQGFTELTQSPEHLTDSLKHGIDHVFEKNGKYYIVDSKSGEGAHLTVLSDGTKQLSDTWWMRRIDSAVGSELGKEIKTAYIKDMDNVVRLVSKVNANEQTVYGLVDSIGNLVKEGGNLNDLLL